MSRGLRTTGDSQREGTEQTLQAEEKSAQRPRWKAGMRVWYPLPVQGKDAREAPRFQGRDKVVVSCRNMLKNLVLV